MRTSKTCAVCAIEKPLAEFPAGGHAKCRPCFRAHRRAQYLDRAQPGRRIYRSQPPADLAGLWPTWTCEKLQAHYGVCDKTLRRWQRMAGLPPKLRTEPPEGFADLAGKVTDVELGRRFGMARQTAKFWRNRLGIAPRPITRDDKVRAAKIGVRKARARKDVQAARIPRVRVGAGPGVRHRPSAFRELGIGKDSFATALRALSGQRMAEAVA